MNEPDVDLVAQAQRGNRSAFEELLRRTSRLVYARLVLETGDPHQAEDLTQETFLQAYRGLEQLQRPSQFRAWLLSIADRVAIDAVRRRHRQKRAEPPRSSSETLAQVPAMSPTPAEEAEQADERAKVLTLLRSLPSEYRLPLTLRFLGGVDQQTMETQLGLSNGSLRGLLHRGLRLLRKKFEQADNQKQ